MEPKNFKSLLPLGRSSFETIRMCGLTYVDKTELIDELAFCRGFYFFAHPRRFGKSLLLSTFASLFEHGLEYFKGLAIESLWKDEKRYKVVRLDFSSIKGARDAEEFRKLLRAQLDVTFGQFGFKYVPHPCLSFFDQLGEWMEGEPRFSYVLLIDEYDAPLTAALEEPELFADVGRELSAFYEAVKKNGGLWRFFFVTGITKLPQSGIFDSLNFVIDISFSGRFATLAGFTEAEIRENFPPHLERAAKALSLSADEVVGRIEENYGGYLFDTLEGVPHEPVRVASPWAVLNFLKKPGEGFIPYWSQSGGTASVLKRYLKGPVFQDPREYFEPKLEDTLALKSGSPWWGSFNKIFLTQSGYLTIKKAYGPVLALDYPNADVALSMADPYCENLFGYEEGFDIRGAIWRAAVAGNADALIAALNQAFLAGKPDTYPATDAEECLGLSVLFLRDASFYALPVPPDDGPDGGKENKATAITFEAKDFRWMLELRFLAASDPESKEKELLDQACSQIADRQQGENSRKELVRVAAVFSEKEHSFTLWKSA